VWWLTFVIPATWEEEIGRIMGQGQPEENVSRDSISIKKLAWWCAPIIYRRSK
jgi:hypothetical protein